MILDALLRFTDATSGDSPTTGTQNSTNVINLGLNSANAQAGGTTRDIGIGDKPALKLLVQVKTAFSGGTSLQIGLQGSTDNSSFTTWWRSPAVAEAALVAGARLYDMDMPRPPAGVAIPQYLRLEYVTVGTHSAGALDAFIVLDRDDQFYSSTGNAVMGGYPAGVTVSN
mgnify:CR=1 FL=1|jgi:hypothetical protein